MKTTHLTAIIAIGALVLTGCTSTNTAENTAETVTTTAAGAQYIEYDETQLANADEGDVILFFHASWCTTCRALDKDIKANAADIPANTTIMTLDYDTETALKQKYGVTIQHTLVQVDSEGNMINKWSGGNSLTTLLAQIK